MQAILFHSSCRPFFTPVFVNPTAGVMPDITTPLRSDDHFPRRKILFSYVMCGNERHKTGREGGVKGIIQIGSGRGWQIGTTIPGHRLGVCA